MGAEIPLWIGGFEKWVTGVNKHTTCEDIVRAVLASNEFSKDHRHKKDRNYTIVERWRRVERPLDSKSRILKVWKTWGDEQCNVRFLMKKVHHPIGKDYRTHRKKQLKIVSKHASKHAHSSTSNFDDDHNIGEYSTCNIEDLRKLIHRQSETLSEQLKKIEEKDDEIDYYETKIHLMRMRELGANYVQETYLGGSDDESAPVEPDGGDSVQQVICMYEKLLEVSRQLEKQERTISNVKSEIIKVREEKETQGLSLDQEMENLRQRLKKLTNIVEEQNSEIEENEKSVAEISRTLYERNVCLQALQSDLERLEKESLRLQQEYDIVHGLQSEKTLVKTKYSEVNNEGADSNSDTGLSSLHSSSDDCAVVLDTLV